MKITAADITSIIRDFGTKPTRRIDLQRWFSEPTTPVVPLFSMGTKELFLVPSASALKFVMTIDGQIVSGCPSPERAAEIFNGDPAMAPVVPPISRGSQDSAEHAIDAHNRFLQER
jgi:hypothetical protein